MLRIVQENNGIPMIITDMAEQIVSSHNLGDLDERIQRKIEQNNPSQSQVFKDSIFQIAKRIH